jgi:tRNA 2-thiouridine synthesizing protein A
MGQPATTLDVRNLNCPLPVLKLKKAIGDIGVGATIEVLATDPGADADFEAFCTSTGHSLIERGENAGVFRFVIRRTA